MIILGELVTLKENKDFRRLYSRGRSYSSSVLVTYVMKNRSRNVRIGITTSKKIGKAVMRNRSRRIIREAYYQLADEIKPGYDLVFVARGRTPFVKSTDILRVMRKELKEAGVLK
ncbi:MAG: ribonuclease P protein component [Acutalibacteraceae bacterium]